MSREMEPDARSGPHRADEAVLVPLPRGRAETADMTADRPGYGPRARPLVLIVEDQAELRRLYAEHLANSGFDVIQAGNGAEALAHTSSHWPDVVVMDLSLPVVDGWEATRRLKADVATARIPVVALTAHDGAGELERATHAGCDWFVPKPCPPDALVAELRRVLTDVMPPGDRESSAPA